MPTPCLASYCVDLVANSSRPAKKKTRVSAARQAGFKALKGVFNGQSLSVLQKSTIDTLEDGRDRGLANELVNGVLRWRWQLEFYLSQLLAKPLKAKDSDVQLVLLMALYELKECRTPDYAIINEAVELVRASGKKWAAGLVNAVLRRFSREQAQLTAMSVPDSVSFSHPDWLLAQIKSDWPADDEPEDDNHGWRQILAANNQRPAFCLRVNQRHSSALAYQQRLAEKNIESRLSELSDHALTLGQGMDVRLLPGFAEGAVSVQDAGAQLAAGLLAVKNGQRVLDLCAAPGGKTCHILERHDVAAILAVELEAQRMQRVRENLQRLQLQAELITGDARDYKQWWDGNAFDRILLDAPCSASGVIRRHPDIKTLRRPSDIAPLVTLQSEILHAAWQMLKPGGELLYVTCSIFKVENQQQISHFLSAHNNAEEISIQADWGLACEHGRQLFPGEQGADGFYYCRLKKTGSA